MNTYDMVLYWQNKYLIMEKEVRKAQKGIVRLKRKEGIRERYLNECIVSNNNKYYEDILDRLEKENKSLKSELTEFNAGRAGSKNWV